MDRQRPLDEEIAAFLDGTLNAEGRTRVLAQAASDPATYEILVEAGAALDELDGEATIPRRRTPWWRGPHGVWVGLAAAAAISALTLGPGIMNPSGAIGTELLAMARAIDARGLPGDWLDGGRVLRSGDPPTPGGAETQGLVETGVGLARLAVALRDAEPDAVGTAATQVASVTSDIARLRGLGRAVSEAGHGLADETGSAELRAAMDDMTEAASSPAFELGLWAEALRLALLAGDTTTTGRLLDLGPEVLAGARAEELPAPLHRLASEVDSLLEGADSRAELQAKLDSITAGR